MVQRNELYSTFPQMGWEMWFLQLRRCQISDPKWHKVNSKTMNPVFKFGYTK